MQRLIYKRHFEEPSSLMAIRVSKCFGEVKEIVVFHHCAWYHILSCELRPFLKTKVLLKE